MSAFEAEVGPLADAGSGERLAGAFSDRFSRDPEDPEAWLAAMGLDRHPRLRKESVWRPLLAVLTEASESVRDPALAWEITAWLAELRLHLDCAQNATCQLTGFLRRFPAHEGALDRLVGLVCNEDGDYREAWWEVDSLAKAADTPERKARALLALALMKHAAFADDVAAPLALIEQARRTYAALDTALLHRWAQQSGCGDRLHRLLRVDGSGQP